MPARKMPLLAAALFLATVSPMAAFPVETDVEAPGPNGPLKGTLLAPDTARAPVVVIIPGSGPTDRDGNSPLGVKASPYRLLAEGLADKGIASIRIDKRGMFASSGAAADANAVTIGDYAADILAWRAVVRTRTGASCVWLLGHSEGGLVALAGSGHADAFCGLILVATAGRPLADLVRAQLKASLANAPILGQALAAVDALEAGHHVDESTLPPALLPLFRRNVQDFLISEFALDPARLIAAWRKPVLIVQGGRDIQVSVEDARRLQQAAPDARLVLVPDANHVLKVVTTPDRAANLATYADPRLPLAPGLVETIAAFIHASSAGR